MCGRVTATVGDQFAASYHANDVVAVDGKPCPRARHALFLITSGAGDDDASRSGRAAYVFDILPEACRADLDRPLDSTRGLLL